ncbi:MAG: DUF2213 domain-containing protein [Methylomicrobium sp.]|nr:DUF2213 domain-containing protein [Methylomicrobium sp.]
MRKTRIDRAELPRMDIDAATGYLKGRGVVTRLGVFIYHEPNGDERRELRHPDDVLRADSLDTLSMIPVTLNHPTELVNSDNTNRLAVGMTGENHHVDGSLIVSPITITDKIAIDRINQGQRALSLGYTADVIDEVGVYNGEPYTHRQTDIRYNHLAIVDRGRAGAAARLNLDGDCIFNNEDIMLKIKIDGVEKELDADLIKSIESKLETGAVKIAELETRIDSMRANEKTLMDEVTKADALRDKATRVDVLQAQLDELKVKLDSVSTVKAAVAKRVKLISDAAKVVEDYDKLIDMDDQEIMVGAIKTVHADVDLTGKSADYIQARFDMVMESASVSEGFKSQAATVTRVDNNEKVTPFSIVREQWKA